MTQSLIILRAGASELLKALAPFLPRPDQPLLPARVIDTQGNYLYLEVALAQQENLKAELLIHHGDVVAVLTDTSDKTIGFVHAGYSNPALFPTDINHPRP